MMQTTIPAESIRKLALRTFHELGASDSSLLSDTLLIRNGRCLGRSFRTKNLMAMWLIDFGLLQFYAADGAMLKTINLLDTLETERLAA